MKLSKDFLNELLKRNPNLEQDNSSLRYEIEMSINESESNRLHLSVSEYSDKSYDYKTDKEIIKKSYRGTLFFQRKKENIDNAEEVFNFLKLELNKIAPLTEEDLLKIIDNNDNQNQTKNSQEDFIKSAKEIIKIMELPEFKLLIVKTFEACGIKDLMAEQAEMIAKALYKKE